MADFMMDMLMADKYLDHRYPMPEGKFFPLPDEAFASKWAAWLEGRDIGGRNSGFPRDVCALLSEPGVRVWLEATPAGGIPVVYAEDRRVFEKLTVILSAKDEERTLPASVNAFTVPAKHPGFAGHRVICLAKAGYSALSREDVGIEGLEDDEWMEKSAAIRLRHECCHYFTLRVLGGMKNHALDEVIADCVGQLSAFGRYSASLQRKFFGLKDGSVLQGGRLKFYMEKLPEGAIPLVCRKVEEALDSLEKYLGKIDEAASEARGPELIVKLATLGLAGIAELER